MDRVFVGVNRITTTPLGAVSLSIDPHESDYNTEESIHWYPMRVTYHRETKIKMLLDNLGIENFLPMHYEYVETKNEGKKRLLVPAIHNLIFVHSSQETITHLKMTREEFSPMRYMMQRSLSDTPTQTIMTVPDRQMDNFIKVASIQDDRVFFLNYDEAQKIRGRRCKIIEGHFAGVEGTIKRISKNKRVVVQIEGVAAVAIAFVPASCLTLQ